MSKILKFDRRQLVALQQNMTHIASRSGDPWIATREEYEEAVEEVGIASNPGRESSATADLGLMTLLRR
jgi:hypothetical protein